MTVIFGRYKMGELIGSGSFGQVYIGESLRSNTAVAIKVDDKYGTETTLAHEAKILNYLRGPSYIPVLRYYGSNSDNSYLVMNLLGRSLEERKRESGTVDGKEAINIGLQCLKMLKYIHGKSIIHRDIKPENFLYGINENASALTMIDFGLSKKYVDSAHKHITVRTDRPVVGTIRYISANVQEGIEPSRRDDIISLAYMLIYLQTEKLPWQGIKKGLIEKDKEICRLKRQTTTSSLCTNLNDCFLHLLLHGKNLKFDEEPKYDRMERKFQDALKKL